MGEETSLNMIEGETIEIEEYTLHYVLRHCIFRYSLHDCFSFLFTVLLFKLAASDLRESYYLSFISSSNCGGRELFHLSGSEDLSTESSGEPSPDLLSESSTPFALLVLLT